MLNCVIWSVWCWFDDALIRTIAESLKGGLQSRKIVSTDLVWVWVINELVTQGTSETEFSGPNGAMMNIFYSYSEPHRVDT